jgi:prepilin-type N-terminal cleavage/methylation domain-containing protein
MVPLGAHFSALQGSECFGKGLWGHGEGCGAEQRANGRSEGAPFCAPSQSLAKLLGASDAQGALARCFWGDRSGLASQSGGTPLAHIISDTCVMKQRHCGPLSPTCSTVQRNGRRGFTLVELLTVVVIISVFAVLTMPTVARQLRDRRTANASQQIAQMYRTARMRAVGRGSAVLVRYNESDGFHVREAVTGNTGGLGGCQLSVISSCTDNPGRWNDASGLYREIDRFDPAHSSAYDMLNLLVHGAGTSVLTNLDVCFTPAGSTFWQTAGGGFGRLSFVPHAHVWSNDSSGRAGIQRLVFILSNGAARVTECDWEHDTQCSAI